MYHGTYGIGMRILFGMFMWLPMLIGWILLLVIAWRAMRAHESLAASLRQLADRQSPPAPPPAE